MAAAAKRAVLVRSVIAKLNQSITAIVVEHIRAERITAMSFEALLAKVRCSFPGLPPAALEIACRVLNEEALSAWSNGIVERVSQNGGDVRSAMRQMPAARGADLPRRPGDGSFLL